MKKGFVSNIVFLLTLNLLIKPVWIFGIDRHVQNKLGEEIYGQYFSLLGFTFLFHILLDFGLQYFNSRNISAHPQLKQKYYSHSVNLKILLGVAYFVVTTIAAFLVGYNKVEVKMLLWLMVNQGLISMLFFMRSNLSGSLKFVQDSIISVLDKLLMITICAFLIWRGIGSKGFDIMQFIYAQTFSYLLTLIVAILLVRNIDVKYNFSFKPKYYLLLVRRAYPYAIAVFLMTVYSRIDAVMLERLLGKEGDFYAGVYAQSFRIMDAANMIGLLMAGVLLPVYARLLSNKKQLTRIVEIAFQLIMVIALPVGMSMIFFNDEIIAWLYPNADATSAEVLFYLGIAHILYAGIYVIGTLLTAAENLKSLNILFSIGVFFNIVLNIYFINKNFAVGAAQATVLTQAVIFLGELYLVFYFKMIYKSLRLYLRFLVFGILLFVVFYFLESWIGPIVIKLAIVGVLSIVLAFGLNLLNKSILQELLPSEQP